MNTIASHDLSEPDFDDAEIGAIRRRRPEMYSQAALSAALPAERVYVSHPAFAAAIRGIDRIYQLSVLSSLPHGALLVGPTGTGKSSLLTYYKESLPPDLRSEVDATVLIVRLQDQPSESRLISALLSEIRYAFSHVTKTTVGQKKDVLLDALAQKGTRLIFVDEAHNMMHQRKRSKDSDEGGQVSDLLRELMDRRQIGLVLSGSLALDELHRFDSHLHARVASRYELKSFSALPQFLAFCRAFASRCTTFNLEAIGMPELAQRMLLTCAGNPRQVKQLIVEAILVAVDSNKKTLDLQVLATAHDRLAGHGALRSNPFREAQP
jgi:type II secretory pathway predicted ATPase ExeA